MLFVAAARHENEWNSFLITVKFEMIYPTTAPTTHGWLRVTSCERVTGHYVMWYYLSALINERCT